MPKKKPIKGKPKVNKELEGLEIRINEFGEIITNYDVNEINKFLNRNVDDKKLRDREDISDEGEFTNKEEADDEELMFYDEDEDMDLAKLKDRIDSENKEEEEDTEEDEDELNEK